MTSNEMVEAFREFVMEHGLPLNDMALFGIRCPYCGKSDRIRQLESPEELENALPSADLQVYRHLWQSLISGNPGLVVCKFCQNALRLVDGNTAESLLE
jgi:uncharacterized Zn-finger protein